jgi:hypothetical protein
MAFLSLTQLFNWPFDPFTLSPLHWHLLVNHVGLVLNGVASLLLTGAVLLRNKPLIQQGLMLVVLAGLFTIPAYLTGEPAANQAWHLKIATQPQLEQHEQAVKPFLFTVLVLGFMALLALGFSRRQGHPSVSPIFALMVLLVLCGNLYANRLGIEVGHSGGSIRRPELVKKASQLGQTAQAVKPKPSPKASANMVVAKPNIAKPSKITVKPQVAPVVPSPKQHPLPTIKPWN